MGTGNYHAPKQDAMGRRKSMPMHGGLRVSAITGPKLKASQRPTYDRCATAFQAHVLWSWYVDQRTGQWLVKVRQSDDWLEVPQGDVDALLDNLNVPVHIHGKTTTTRKATTMTISKAERQRRLDVADVKLRNKLAAEAAAKPPQAPEVPEAPQAPAAASEITEPAQEYIGRLVNEGKRLYAIGVAQAIASGEAAPESEADWAPKVVAKVTRLMRVPVAAAA